MSYMARQGFLGEKLQAAFLIMNAFIGVAGEAQRKASTVITMYMSPTGEFDSAHFELLAFERGAVLNSEKRNFNILYQTCCEQLKSSLSTISLHNLPDYLFFSLLDTAENLQDLNESYDNTCNAFAALGIEDPMPIFEACACVLNLGNLIVEECEESKAFILDEGSEGLGGRSSFAEAAKFLELEEDELAKILTTRLVTNEKG